MDESLITQTVTTANPDGTATAKRPRVSVGGDNGLLQDFELRRTGYVEGHVSDISVFRILEEILAQMTAQTGLLRIIAMQLDAEDTDTATALELGTLD
jgi:hypothetical protein